MYMYIYIYIHNLGPSSASFSGFPMQYNVIGDVNGDYIIELAPKIPR